MIATARAHANIAFVKYWGKRDLALNLPAAGSLSLTLDALFTTTTVTFGTVERDTLVLDGQRITDGAALEKARRIINLVRHRARRGEPVLIESENTFPTGAGLASSASGLAALALASAHAAGLHLDRVELSQLARQGSGSACRSIWGGFVQWQAGTAADGSDSYAQQLFPPQHWDLRGWVAVISAATKPVTSSAGMLSTAESSPYYDPYLQQVDVDLVQANSAIAQRSLDLLAQVAERSCLRMHAAMMAADPPLIYLQPASWEVIQRIRMLRQEGVPVFFTVDAGPNVKAFCTAEASATVQQSLSGMACVQQLIGVRPGPGATLLDPTRVTPS